mgnify:CR=1 FL=1
MGFWESLRKGLGLDKASDLEIGEELVEQGVRRGMGAAEDYQLGPDDGVRVSPMPVTAQSEIAIAYSGLLAKAGATELYVHCGEGPGPWQNVRDVPMTPGPDGAWIARLTAGEGGTLEFCFHDAAGNWDNNNGVNWSVTVHAGRNPH